VHIKQDLDRFNHDCTAKPRDGQIDAWMITDRNNPHLKAFKAALNVSCAYCVRRITFDVKTSGCEANVRTAGLSLPEPPSLPARTSSISASFHRLRRPLTPPPLPPPLRTTVSSAAGRNVELASEYPSGIQTGRVHDKVLESGERRSQECGLRAGGTVLVRRHSGDVSQLRRHLDVSSSRYCESARSQPLSRRTSNTLPLPSAPPADAQYDNRHHFTDTPVGNVQHGL